MDKVTSQSVYTDNEISFRLEEGFLNGLSIYMTGGFGDSTITVKHKQGDKPATYLANDLPLRYVQAMADQQGGHKLTNTLNLQAIVKSLDELIAAGTGITALPSDLSDFSTRSFKTNTDLELGSLPLYNASLDITINVAFSGGGQRNVTVYRYETERTLPFMQKYETSLEVKETFHDVQRIYAFTESVDNKADVSFKISDYFETVQADYEALHQKSLSKGNVELIPSDDLAVEVYRPLTIIPEQVRIEQSGADASTTTLMVVQVLYSTQDIAQGARDSQKIRERLRVFKAEHGDKFNAMSKIFPQLG